MRRIRLLLWNWTKFRDLLHRYLGKKKKSRHKKKKNTFLQTWSPSADSENHPLNTNPYMNKYRKNYKMLPNLRRILRHKQNFSSTSCVKDPQSISMQSHVRHRILRTKISLRSKWYQHPQQRDCQNPHQIISQSEGNARWMDGSYNKKKTPTKEIT